MWLQINQLICGCDGGITMPVYLDAIPDVAPKIERPDTRRWLYLLAVALVTGNVLTFWQWTGNREGFTFWFTALGLPFCIWGLVFSFRRFGYKCDQVWAASWDRERMLLIEEETARGQRSARILASGVNTQPGNGSAKLLSAVKSAASQLSMQVPRAGGLPVRHSRLPGFKDMQQRQDLDAVLKSIASQVSPVLESIPAGVPSRLMVDCDIAGIPDAPEQISRVLSSLTDRRLRLLNIGGLAALDLWLDEAWSQPTVLIILSAVVRAEPLEDEGEAIAWLLLLNRHHAAFPDAVKLHRPEKGHADTLSQTLNRALLWCRKPPEDMKAAWTTGKDVAQGGEWISACEANGITFSMTEDNHDVDQTTGYTGQAAPWLGIALAAAAAQHSGPQVVVAQTSPDDIWIVGITADNKTGKNRDLS
ncbi:hypothetical protein M979_1895 [Buttiauxella noackiae ATCC 51607]|uniref:Uncharacterized protein n=2 Tax=Buttiauxella TaxID=82976 RepID=A0A1B7HQZ1_9ENTR|nr:hypothetical protein M979_1895 [Buttiauxella noackiae ATCC 51607]